MEILVAVLILGGLGLFFGIGLMLASKRLAVKTDPRLERVHGLLPGVNCGACGGAGCFTFAEELLSGKINISACRVAEEEVISKIAGILGQEVKVKARLTATLHCNGGKKAGDRFLYNGIEDCVSASLVMQGQKACSFGCLGYADCRKVCPFGAIEMSDENLPVVIVDKCKACNKCVEACPKKLFSLIAVSQPVYVACLSHDGGKITRSVCPVGCIACKRCEKVCKFDAIHVIDNLAKIDYNKCTSCGECVKACPMKTIIIRSKE